MRRLLAFAAALLPPALRAKRAEHGRAKLIAASGLFDAAWYLERYPDARGSDPIAHYLRHGATHAPNPLFRGDWYLGQNPDVRAAGMNPLVHYLLRGAAEGRKPNPLFDGTSYLRQNPDVAASGQNPLAHYLRNGANEGRPPHPLSLGLWHLEQRLDPDGARAACRPAAPPQQGDRTRDGAAPLTFEAAGAGAAEPALAAALAAAAAQGRHLLVLIGAAPSSDDVARLTATLEADPMIGYAIPRFADANGAILPLPSAAQESSAYERRILPHLPAFDLAPEFVAACVLIRREIAANFPARAAGLRSMPAALRLVMTWGRRLGYRAAIVNTAVVPAPAGGAYPVPASDERGTLALLFPDIVQADLRFGALAAHRRDALLGRALSGSAQRRLLVDCTGMPAHHNGTSECILGILGGIARLNTDWRIDLLASAEATAFHGLPQRCPYARVIDRMAGTYAVAIRLSQPWSLASIAELHRHALAVAVMMLDTIAWDIIYLASPEVERTWRFAAAYLDGILHISEFTRDRFNLRFPAALDVRQEVMHLSCHPDDYPVADKAIQRRHILLVGNDYDHKALSDTLLTLAHAFPDQQFVAIGYAGAAPANVRAFASGRLTAADIDALHAGARLMVFPSFYEGFGFPVVRGLAHGIDVMARSTALLTEIADHCRGSGRIIPFDDPASLIAVVNAALAGEPVETLPLGRALVEEPPRWRDVAARFLAFAEELAAAPSWARHEVREAALRLALPE